MMILESANQQQTTKCILEASAEKWETQTEYL